MFALGDYTGAAAVLDNLLAVAPGMDWTTLSGLYGNVEAYTAQLRALEAYCKQKPDDAAAHFVLAYQYLVAGYDDAAAEQLKRVVAAAARRPGGRIACLRHWRRRPHATTEPAPPEQPAGSPPAQAGPTTDLVGNWRAERNGDVFDLSIDENSQFTWKAVPRASSRSPWPERWRPPATRSCWRARTRARWPPRSSRTGRTSSSSSPPAVRRRIKGCRSNESDRAVDAMAQPPPIPA